MSIANIGSTVGALLHSAGIALQAGKQGPHNWRPFVERIGRRAAIAGLAMGLLAASGCGNTYRPVVTAINPVGPAGQPTKYAVAISDPNLGSGGSLQGLVTFVDFSGDTVLITSNIGVNPKYLILNNGNTGGTGGLTLDADGTINSFNLSTALIASTVTQTTLLPSPAPNQGLIPTSIFPFTTATYVAQPGRGSIAELTGNPLVLQQELKPVGPVPTYITGVNGAPRVYVLSPSLPAGSAGSATPIETSTNTPETALPVGVNPIYGIMTGDTRRAFIMNQGSNSVTVIDAQNNQLDTGVTNGTIQDPKAVSPIWADFAPPLSELVVANAGNATSACPNRPDTSGCGSISIFSIPLCSVAAPTGNPNCNVNNPIDSSSFGTLVANIPVGKNPLMIAALQDGTQAYVINQGDSTVSVINLTTNAVTATIPVPDSANPTFIAVTTGTPTGKVYVTSSTSKLMTVIRTDTNAVDTTISLQGYGIQVRTSAP